MESFDTFFYGFICGTVIILLIISILSIKRKCSYRLSCNIAHDDVNLCDTCKGFGSCTISKQRRDLLAMTRCFNKHPDGYSGPCECKECLSKK